MRLETSFVVQPFDWAVRLASGCQRKFDGRGYTYKSYASFFVSSPRVARRQASSSSTGIPALPGRRGASFSSIAVCTMFA